MLTVRVGKTKMARRPNFSAKLLLKYMLVLVSAAALLTLLLQNYSIPFKDELRRALSGDFQKSVPTSRAPSKGPCDVVRDCPEDHFSFFVRSGAANVVAPKICLQNKLVLGTVLNNAGVGINIVIINGKTGDVVKTAHFDMYSGDVKPLVELLKSIETGAVVLMASYDEPATKLNEEARKLIAELGSVSVKSLGFRDNWVFVGGKGASVHSNFEKYLKNDNAKNKYENWPELIEIQGCIPKYPE
ncbi:protein FAM3C isoform X2 [Sander lucioperca]|uniref:protein FAM3C isoform X2 n=1 Tax=Sander lucioperca TaxID=283035 RepID=UPI00125DDBCE|nr:protein FAM3C isoform X2 [Sander lucioperca]